MGVATTFAITHRGIDGKPVPSRHADLSELIALGDVLNEMGKGVVQVTPGKQLPISDIYDFQRRIGRPLRCQRRHDLRSGVPEQRRARRLAVEWDGPDRGSPVGESRRVMARHHQRACNGRGSHRIGVARLNFA